MVAKPGSLDAAFQGLQVRIQALGSRSAELKVLMSDMIAKMMHLTMEVGNTHFLKPVEKQSSHDFNSWERQPWEPRRLRGRNDAGVRTQKNVKSDRKNEIVVGIDA